jgi:competence protein ComEA
VPEQPTTPLAPAALGPAAQPPAAPAVPAVGEAMRASIATRLPTWAADRIEQTTASSVVTVLLAVVCVVVIAAVYLHRHAGPAPPPSYSSAAFGDAPGSAATGETGTGAATAAASDVQSIVVDVGGRVRKPGLVTLPLGARVADAIAAAGGPLRQRELNRIDLAERVTDGQLLLIGVSLTDGVPAGEADGTGLGPSSAPVSLSAATLDQLETLPGVGPVTAQKILDWRSAHGGFTSVSQLQQVPGIGPAHYAAISPLVTP